MDKPVLKAGAHFHKCKVKRFLSQSFFVAEIFARVPGKIVDLKTICFDFDDVVSGNCDDTLVAIFFTVGDLMDVNKESSRRVRLRNIGRSLRTASLGLMKWIRGNGTSLDLHELRI